MCLVEVTKNNTLEKVRNDITKLSAVGFTLLRDEIYSEKYIVLSGSPTNSMRELAAKSKIKILSFEEFEKKWFDYKRYVFLRSQQSFGSAVDIQNGNPETGPYIPVVYVDAKTGDKYDINKIATKLKRGAKIILKGSFGTGKSRCVKQLFDLLSKNHEESFFYTISINLREHWGAKNYKEILQRHFDDLSFNFNNFKRICTKSNIIFLLDGFDEIGSQSWSVDSEKMHLLREKAVLAIKDLVLNTQGGCLITGREHYFNSDNEMLNCLGLDNKSTLILQCAEEFNEEQIKQYIKTNCDKTVQSIPKWLPKRPLIMSIAIHNVYELFNNNTSIVNEYDFWSEFLSLLAKREAKINSALHDETIKNIMIKVSRISRTKEKDLGPITVMDLNKAFEDITGERPNEESAIMLHRLPGLGRVNADTNDRMFVDSYILNGLRAEDIINIVEKNEVNVYNDNWINALNLEGVSILSSYLELDDEKIKKFLNTAVLSSRKNNAMLSADIVSTFCKIKYYSNIDFKGIVISEIHIQSLDFSNKKIENLNFINSWIDELDITNVGLESVNFSNCIIGKIKGIATKSSLPETFIQCEVDEYQPVSTVARIKTANLSRAQTILLTIIKKIFSTISKGNGRKEEALLRGLGDRSDSKICDKILNKMITDQIITKHKGKEGWVYSPVLKNTERMCNILSDLSNSKDELWYYASELE